MMHLIKWLSEKSTIAGIAGLAVSGSAAFGAEWAADPEAVAHIYAAAPMIALPVLSLLSMLIRER
jgi:protein involved in ribonucleotide reduction